MLARRLPLVLALVVPALWSCRSRSVRQGDPAQAILAQERRALDQWAQGNSLGYLDVDADDVTYFDDIGAQSRVDGIEAMRQYLGSLNGRIPRHTYDLVDPKVQVYGDIGILTLHYNASATDGTPLAHWKATSVYRWIGNQWRIVHAHWSLVKGQ